MASLTDEERWKGVITCTAGKLGLVWPYLLFLVLIAQIPYSLILHSIGNHA